MKVITGIILAAAMVPGLAMAEEAINIDVIGVSDGVMNFEYEHGLNRKSAMTVGYATASGVMEISPGFKAALGGELGDGAYVLGSVDIWMGGGSSLTGFSAKVGYDVKLAESTSVAPFYGISSLSGTTVSGYGVNVGFRF